MNLQVTAGELTATKPAITVAAAYRPFFEEAAHRAGLLGNGPVSIEEISAKRYSAAAMGRNSLIYFLRHDLGLSFKEVGACFPTFSFASFSVICSKKPAAMSVDCRLIYEALKALHLTLDPVARPVLSPSGRPAPSARTIVRRTPNLPKPPSAEGTIARKAATVPGPLYDEHAQLKDLKTVGENPFFNGKLAEKNLKYAGQLYERLNPWHLPQQGLWDFLIGDNPPDADWSPDIYKTAIAWALKCSAAALFGPGGKGFAASPAVLTPAIY